MRTATASCRQYVARLLPCFRTNDRPLRTQISAASAPAPRGNVGDVSRYVFADSGVQHIRNRGVGHRVLPVVASHGINW